MNCMLIDLLLDSSCFMWTIMSGTWLKINLFVFYLKKKQLCQYIQISICTNSPINCFVFAPGTQRHLLSAIWWHQPREGRREVLCGHPRHGGVAWYVLRIFSPLRSIAADGFIAWRNKCLSVRLWNLANKSGVAALSVTKNCCMEAIYLT